MQETELKEARETWESRTGCKSRMDGMDDELAFCPRLESRSSNSDQLPEISLLGKLTMFEQAPHSWSSFSDSPVNLYSADPRAWAGISSLTQKGRQSLLLQPKALIIGHLSCIAAGFSLFNICPRFVEIATDAGCPC